MLLLLKRVLRRRKGEGDDDDVVVGKTGRRCGMGMATDLLLLLWPWWYAAVTTRVGDNPYNSIFFFVFFVLGRYY